MFVSDMRGSMPAPCRSARDDPKTHLAHCLAAHRRLSQARLATEGAPAALQELSLLFPSKGPRQPFSIAVTQIVAGEGVDAAGGGRKGKKRGRARRAEQAGEAPAGGQGLWVLGKERAWAMHLQQRHVPCGIAS